MNSYLQSLGLNLPATTNAEKTRRQVLTEIPWSPASTSSVSYVAASRVLVIADEGSAEKAEQSVQPPIQLYLAEVRRGANTFIEGNCICLDGICLEGYLGRFRATVGDQPETTETEQQEQERNVAFLLGIASGLFDQVIDCSEQPILGAAITPPGYHHVGSDRQAFRQALRETSELVGEFDKPRYFDYDPSICAHGRSGINGCTRCLDACPTDAIISIGEEIEVNPYLCQGGGTCASSCPSGAITYRYPVAEDQINLLRQVMRQLRESENFAGIGIGLLFYDSETGKKLVEQGIDCLPEYMVPMEVEEVGSIGLDLMTSGLAYGATEIYILLPETLPGQVADSLQRDITLLDRVLGQLELDQYRVTTVESLDQLSGGDGEHGPLPERQASVATYAGAGNKRSIIRSAVNYFVQQSSVEQSSLSEQSLEVPEGSLFGQVVLNSEACTLCMGCVSVCPASALEAGGEEPALKFIEANCVQCGICTRACPESALELEPRILLDEALARSARVLKSEEPFRCIKCNKAFATQAMIKRMTEKLSGHWMFETADALSRLKMCEDCRVADMYDRTDMIG